VVRGCVCVCVCVCVFVRVCEGLKNFWSTFPDLPDGVSNSCEITGVGRRCMGCVKSQVSFRTRATDYRAFLRKITYRDKVSYASSPRCMIIQECSNSPECIYVYILYMYVCICIMYVSTCTHTHTQAYVQT